MAQRKILALLVGGGPAPGINSVISSAAIEALNCGFRVIGIYDGFKWLLKGATDKIEELAIADVSRLHFAGGSVLRTSRENPLKKPDGIATVLASLKKLNVTHLITIGGDDTATSAVALAEAAQDSLQVVHVPKTIDNDLPLPEGNSTFGFQSARHYGTFIIQNLMEDAKTTGRWYIVTTMGRGAGFLALGICFAAGATLAVIPEEFQTEKVPLRVICDIIEASIVKRKWGGKNDGVVILAEGLGERLSLETSIKSGKEERDEFDHLRLSELDLGKLVKEEIKKRFAARGQKITLVNKDIGYELRSCPPTPFDIDYTRRLGYGAVRHLIGGHSKALICYQGGVMQPLPFEEIYDKKTGHVKTRQVDIHSEYYEAALSYMIRLKREDLEDETTLKGLAETAGMSPEKFKEKFQSSLKKQLNCEVS